VYWFVPLVFATFVKLNDKLMNRLVLFGLTAALTLSCSGGKKEEAAETGFQISRTQEAAPVAKAAQTPVDLSNKGIGPIKKVTFTAEVDAAKAARGQDIFESKCTMCHEVGQRMIGPAVQGTLERRSPEWVANLLLNTQEMLQKDPIAKALLKEYNNAMMINQNLSEPEALAVLEYLRTL
jgi:cytochrome c5